MLDSLISSSSIKTSILFGTYGDNVGDNVGSSVGWSSSGPIGGHFSESGSSTMILGHQVMSAKHFSPFS